MIRLIIIFGRRFPLFLVMILLEVFGIILYYLVRSIIAWIGVLVVALGTLILAIAAGVFNK